MGKSMPTIPEPESPLKTPGVDSDKVLKPFISVINHESKTDP